MLVPNFARKRQALAQLSDELAYLYLEGGPAAQLIHLEARVARRQRGLPFRIRSCQPRRGRKVGQP